MKIVASTLDNKENELSQTAVFGRTNPNFKTKSKSVKKRTVSKDWKKVKKKSYHQIVKEKNEKRLRMYRSITP